ncbi:hypothetical protein NA57DRAFT_54469 [Rhizodiscina lignyota]|uniref:Uncharacterized protein n=1 Tax=Rhizodiscina lignyota TaxID=1504668 RepID=A0A9P4MAH5_9PEZI|nr:hypothetical protein NA57DRAFT_54469 [Rhizodiscina lignyota]
MSKGKPIFTVGSPYTAPSWPHLKPDEQGAIVDLLCSVLSPIGHHRVTNTHPSKGKRQKKRKRDSASDESIPDANLTETREPGIANFVTVGLNSTSRHLEALSAPLKDQTKQTSEVVQSEYRPPLSAIFLPKARNDMIYAHLPLLAQTASSAQNLPAHSATRLVPLDSKHEQKLASSLGLPRAGVVGLMEGAPGTDALIEYVRSKVEPIDVPWLREAAEAKYMGLKVDAVEVKKG